MTKWERPLGRSTRRVGRCVLVAYPDGAWRIAGTSALGEPWRPEDENLASAQAAADAAVEQIHAAMGADLGLVFGPVTDGRFGPIRYAVAVDGALYEMSTEPDEPDVAWRMRDDPDAWGYEDTPGKAIAAARRHDAARRGAK